MTAEIHQMPEPKLRLQCVECGVTIDAACDCGAGYVTAAEAVKFRRARVAVLHQQGLTLQQIAERLGVSHQTIGRDFETLSIMDKVTRTDRLGRKNTGRPIGAKKKRKFSPETEQMAATLILDAGKTKKEAAAATGVSDTVIRHAVAREEGRREAMADPTIDPTTLSLSAQEKLAAALRQQKQIHEREYQRRLEEGISKWIEETTIASYVDEYKKIRADIERRDGIMTAANYKLILRCLHPDNSASTKMRAEAFVLWEKLRYRFCDNTEMPVPLRGMPETAAGWEALRRAKQAARKAKRNGSAMEKR